jgi:exodeoxyribonuclease VII large subunit
MQSQLSLSQRKLERLSHQAELHSPVRSITQQKYTLSRSRQRLLDAMDRQLLNRRHRIALAAETLDAVSPLATLKRGYSITRDEQNKVIRHASDAQPGSRLITTLADGEIRSIVEDDQFAAHSPDSQPADTAAR